MRNWNLNVGSDGEFEHSIAELAYDYSVLYSTPPDRSIRWGFGGEQIFPALRPLRSQRSAPPGVDFRVFSVFAHRSNFGTPNIRLRFIAWSHFTSAPNASGLADNAIPRRSTNNVIFGAGTSGTAPLVVGNTVLVTTGVWNGVWICPNGRAAAITSDYRVIRIRNNRAGSVRLCRLFKSRIRPPITCRCRPHFPRRPFSGLSRAE